MTLSTLLEGTLEGTLPDGPANRNTPVCPLLAVCASVGDTSSNRLAGSFSSADPATRDRYCKSASGRWKDAMPPATHTDGFGVLLCKLLCMLLCMMPGWCKEQTIPRKIHFNVKSVITIKSGLT